MDYVRLYMLMKLSESLTDEEKQLLAGRDRESQHREVMNELAKIKKQGSFGRDVVANVTGNYIADFSIFLFRNMIRRLR